MSEPISITLNRKIMLDDGEIDEETGEDWFLVAPSIHEPGPLLGGDVKAIPYKWLTLEIGCECHREDCIVLTLESDSGFTAQMLYDRLGPAVKAAGWDCDHLYCPEIRNTRKHEQDYSAWLYDIDTT